MNQQGFIMEIVDDRTAKLKMQRHSACLVEKCATTNSAESKEILVEVDNTIGAKVGDHVEVSMDNMNVLKGCNGLYNTSYSTSCRNNRDLLYIGGNWNDNWS